MTVIDSHLHVWDLDRADYPWLGPHLAPIDVSLGLDDVRADLRFAGVDGVVLVQAADNAEDTDTMFAVADGAPEVAGSRRLGPPGRPGRHRPPDRRTAGRPAVRRHSGAHSRPGRPGLDRPSGTGREPGVARPAPRPVRLRDRGPVGPAPRADHLCPASGPLGGDRPPRQAAGGRVARAAAVVAGAARPGGRVAVRLREGLRAVPGGRRQRLVRGRICARSWTPRSTSSGRTGSCWAATGRWRSCAGGYRRVWGELARIVGGLQTTEREAILGGTAAAFYGLGTG